MDKVLCKRRRRISLLILLYLRLKKIKNQQKQRRYWVHPILQQRQQQGDWHNLIQEMRFQNDGTFFNYMRMTPAMFDNILAKIGPKITKLETNWRSPISAATRLAITLRYDMFIHSLTQLMLNYVINL